MKADCFFSRFNRKTQENCTVVVQIINDCNTVHTSSSYKRYTNYNESNSWGNKMYSNNNNKYNYNVLLSLKIIMHKLKKNKSSTNQMLDCTPEASQFLEVCFYMQEESDQNLHPCSLRQLNQSNPSAKQKSTN